MSLSIEMDDPRPRMVSLVKYELVLAQIGIYLIFLTGHECVQMNV